MTFSSQVILSIFFLYVVIVSEKLFSIISCSLQKTVENSRTFKHMFIFLNIFLFTFILGWYTEKSIHSAKISYNDDEDNTEGFTQKNSNLKLDFYSLYREEFIVLGKYLLYSFIIYLIFLLTTKCEIKFLLVFFILIIILFIFFLLRTYSKNPKYYKFEKIKLIDYISPEKQNEKIEEFEKNLNKMNLGKEDKFREIKKFKINLTLQNVEFILFIIALIILIIGFSFYFRRKYNQYYHNWSFLTFLLGTNICKKINRRNSINQTNQTNQTNISKMNLKNNFV